MKILIDMDGVLYDLYTPWFTLYNTDYPHHPITVADVKEFNTSLFVAPECGTKIFDYFEQESVWANGGILDSYAGEVTKRWVADGYDVIVCTKASTKISIALKLTWLEQHFPHIDGKVITYGKDTHIKSWFNADVLIDDALHNHSDFTGISILYDQPWNQKETEYIRVKNWRDIEHVVNDIETYTRHGYTHKEVQRIIHG